MHIQQRFGGAYLPVNFNDIREIAYDTEKLFFASGGCPRYPAAPERRCPADHHRSAKAPVFADGDHAAVLTARDQETDPGARANCAIELIDKFADKGEFDGAADYSQHIPVHVIAHMLGIPDSDADQFRSWIGQILIDGILDDDALNGGLHEITAYMAVHLEERRRNPGNDLISYLAQQHYEDGEPLKEKHILGSLRLILIAGIDTTWSGIGASIWHLARTPSDRERLVREPELINSAVEEFLRAYAPVTMARYVESDQTVNGCPMKAGQTLLLPFPAANRDPKQFDRPDEVIIDRPNNKHVAFGMGIHRCVGMHLARMELRVALEELLKRIPSFRLAGETTWSRGPIRGPRSLPLAFDV